MGLAALDVEATGAALSLGRFLLGPASAVGGLRCVLAVGLPTEVWIVQLLATVLQSVSCRRGRGRTSTCRDSAARCRSGTRRGARRRSPWLSKTREGRAQ